MPVDKLIVGPMVAVATPFKDDFSIDYKAFETNLKFMTEKGLKNENSTLLIVNYEYKNFKYNNKS